MMLDRARLPATVAAAVATLTACATVVPLFDSARWVLPTLIAVLVIAATGALARAVALPAALQPLLQLLVLLTLLTITFVQPSATWGLLPGPDAIEALQQLTRAGLIEAEAALSPVPTTTTLTLLAVGGIGLVALVVDTIGVTLRLPAVAGIPLLLMYALPAAVVRGGVAWWLLPIAVLGWLLLLAVDQREDIRSWGRLLTVRSQSRAAAGPSAHPRASRARGGTGIAALQVGLVAVLVALLLPSVVPGLSEPVWVSSGGVGTGAGNGGGPVTVDPFASMRRDLISNSDREVLRYSTDADRPSYLRLVTLDTFDGETWRPGEVPVRVPATESLGIPDVNGVADVRQRIYDVQITDLDNAQLPVPYAAARLQGDIDERWSWDPAARTVSGEGVTSRGNSYRVTSYDVSPTRAELRAADAPAGADMRAYLRLPDDITPDLARLAAEVTADARTPYAQAVALVEWFADDFAYSTSVTTPDGADPVQSFLDERIGYCQQFAGTMALMARSLGIPARVNVGFTAGRQGDDGTWSVQAKNAHAWPELWFPEIGWVWFEPTPRADPGAGVAQPPYSEPRDEGTPETDTPNADRGGRQIPLEERGGLADPPMPTTSSTTPSWTWLLVIIAVGILLLVPVAWVRVRRWRRTSSPDSRERVEGAWQDLGDSALDLDLGVPASATPRQAGDRWDRGVHLSDDERQALARLVRGVEGARYAVQSTVASPQELRADLALVRRGLIRASTRPERIRAMVMPASVWRRGGE